MSNPEQSDGSIGGVRFGLSLLAAMIIGAVFFALAAHTVPIESVRAYIGEIDWGRLSLGSAVFVVIYAVCHGARIARWHVLVGPLGDVDFKETCRVGAVGFTAILLLPLRLGELVRPFLLAHRNSVSGAGAVGTIVVERILDGLVVTGLLFAGLWTYQGEASTELARTAGTVAAAIFVPALGMCLLARYSRRLARRVVMATVGRFSERVGGWIADLFDQFATGLEGMSRRGELVRFLGATAVYWGANVISMWALLTIGFDLEVGLWEMITVMAVLVVGIMVPAGPALAGNFEYFMVQGLGLYVAVDQAGVAGEVGAYAALVHLLQIAVIVAPGVWVMVRHRALRLNRETVEASQSLNQTGT